MLRGALILCIYLLSLGSYGQDRSHYVFGGKGKRNSFKKLLQEARGADIIFFGELHNNPICHWLQYELTKELHKSKKLILAAEMFERDNQDEIDAYLNSDIDAKTLDSTARLWKNYTTDYAPLLNFAKKNHLDFIGSNIPRRFASRVYKGGFEALDTLSVEQKSWIAPLPIRFNKNLVTYQKILEMMGEHGSPELVKAQAIKDATMAYSIAEAYKEEYTLIHFNGAYHSDFYEGIVWYLKILKPKLKIITISSVEQESISRLNEEHLNKADFIICIDEDMTKTY